MKRLELQKLTIDELVERFAALGLEQDEAKVEKVEEELKSRTPDQRRALLPLYDHENDQVRLNAANATLAVSPKDARALLEAIAESGVFPQRGDAGMALWALDEGISEPT